MQVRAIALGYGGRAGDHALRQIGEVFEMDDAVAKVALARPGGTWFEPVEIDRPARRAAKDDALA